MKSASPGLLLYAHNPVNLQLCQISSTAGSLKGCLASDEHSLHDQRAYAALGALSPSFICSKKMATGAKENRDRLIRLLDQVAFDKTPAGWRHVVSIAVGGLESVGFSQQGPYLLVVSSAGRSLIDCNTGEKIERDYEVYAGLSTSGLHCHGLGLIADELVQLAGLSGGGLPLSNSPGETLEVVSPDWPESRLILCEPLKSPFVDGHQTSCKTIYVGYLRAYGFSWCGNYIVAACGSDLDLWSRLPSPSAAYAWRR